MFFLMKIFCNKPSNRFSYYWIMFFFFSST
uniref:Uncharacterized protein n=1 Tax=Rhizophora mucronata TaxID=61149 RepID=A0A2P2N8I3_RHIMU